MLHWPPSIEHSGGQRVHHDLQKLSNFSLFPGQVIKVRWLVLRVIILIASKVVDSLPVPTNASIPPAKKMALDQEQPPKSSHNSRVLSMIIAAGPYITTDNLLFEPLKELLAYASRIQPQLLILLGPFVDSEHLETRKGTADRSFDGIFYDEVLKRSEDHVKIIVSTACIVLVPSIRDANHDFVFPQVLSLDGDDGEIRRCLCVNPGRLAKGIGGGHFSELNYNTDSDRTSSKIIRI